MTQRPLLTAILTLAAVFGSTCSAVAAEVQPLARGPVHEAYADPAEREPKAAPIVRKMPPKPVDELPPDQKPEGENVRWIPGYWAWDEDKQDFLWVSGFWRVAPPGRAWVPGAWRQAGDGWQWTSGFWAEPKDGAAEMQYLPQPPAPLDQAGPTTPAPSANHVYVPGSWVYRDRYVWRPGYWCAHRPGWVWVSSSYRWTPAGYVYVDGYWDYPLASRGVLFAPAYIPPVVYADPAFVYTPTVVVREECLYGAFFARRGFGCYYFGDYFEPRYASLGFVSWCGNVSATVSIGGWCDPLFSYYRCGFGHDPFWRAGVFDLYCGRFRGDYWRPPVDLVQQNTVINNITNNTTIVNNNTTVNNINNVQMLTNIRERNRIGDLNIRQVPDGARREQAEQARDLQTVAERRRDRENQLAAGPRPTRPETSRLDLPTTRPEPKGPAGISRPTATGAATAANPGAPRPTAQIPPKADPVRPGSPAVAGARPNTPAGPGSARPTGPTASEGPTTPRPLTPGVTSPGNRPAAKLDVPAVGPTPGNRPTPKVDAPAAVGRPATAAGPATAPTPRPVPKADAPGPVTRPAPTPSARPAGELPRISPQAIPTAPVTPRASSQPLPPSTPPATRPATTPAPVSRPALPSTPPTARPANSQPARSPAAMSFSRPATPSPINRPAMPSIARQPSVPSRPVTPSVARSFNPPTTSRPAPVAPRPSFTPSAMAQSRPANMAPRPAASMARSAPAPRPTVSPASRPAVTAAPRPSPKAPTTPARPTTPTRKTKP